MTSDAFVDYVCGQLDPAEAARVEAELARSPRRARAVQRMQRAWASLEGIEAGASTDFNARLRQRWEAALREESTEAAVAASSAGADGADAVVAPEDRVDPARITAARRRMVSEAPETTATFNGELRRRWQAECDSGEPERKPLVAARWSATGVRRVSYGMAACLALAPIAIWLLSTVTSSRPVYGIFDLAERIRTIDSLHVQGWRFVEAADGSGPQKEAIEWYVQRPNTYLRTYHGATGTGVEVTDGYR